MKHVLKENLAFGNLQSFQNLEINYDIFLLVKRRVTNTNVQTDEKSLQYHTCTTLMRNCLSHRKRPCLLSQKKRHGQAPATQRM